MPPRSLTLGLLAAAALLGPLANARAADLDENYGYAEAPQEVPVVQSKVEFGTGWYVRGDLGATRLPQVTTNQPALGIAPDLTVGEGSHVGYVASLGAGYQILPWLRSDVSADFNQPVRTVTTGAPVNCVEAYRQYQSGTSSAITSTTQTTTSTTTNNVTTTTVNPATTTTVGTPIYSYEPDNSSICTSRFTAKIHSYNVLVNGYIDLYHWHGITPYVGAGVGLGFGYYSASSNYFQGDGTPYNIILANPGNGVAYHFDYDQSKSGNFYNFAFALMAGVSFDIFNHTKLDIGYRYVNEGKVLGATLDFQEVRAGLRYMIDN